MSYNNVSLRESYFMPLLFEMGFVLRRIPSAQWRTFILVLIIQVTQVASDCKYGSKRSVTIPETATIKDGALLRITGQNAEMSFEAYSDLPRKRSFTNYFTLGKTRGNNGRDNFALYLQAGINMDSVRDVWRLKNGGLVITVKFTCRTKVPANVPDTINYFHITVLPVDNYPPVIPPNAVVIVREDQPLSAPFANLRQVIQDNDFPDTTVLKSCYITRDPNNQCDGSDTFAVSNNGDLRPIIPLDYESGDRMYQLNVTTKNNVSQTAKGVVTVKIINVNDNPVRFVYKGCLSQCYYVLSTFGPGRDTVINATDADNDTIEYSITNVSPATESGIMAINKTTGKIRQMQHPNDHELSMLTLTIKAKAKSSLPIAKNRTEASLNEDFATVKIYFEVSGQLGLLRSGSGRVLVGGLFLPVCLILIYVASKSVI